MRSGKFWLNVFLVCIGVVIGAMVSDMTADVSFLNWLSYGLSFGTAVPFQLDLKVIQLTFGVNLHLTVSNVIFIALSLVLGKLIVRK